MKTLYIECNMGAAGDMLASALLELVDNPDEIISALSKVLPGAEIKRLPEVKCGIAGTRFEVAVAGRSEHSHDVGLGHENDHAHEHEHEHGHEHEHFHSHSGIGDIQNLISGMEGVSEYVKAEASAVYALLAEAEAAVHGRPVSEVHFHEVGALDAVADITAVCMLMERLSPGRIIVSPVNTGFGNVRCAHGVLPVPAPATARLLRGIPSYSGGIEGELCTPTGAALLRHFASSFGGMPVMAVGRVGYGMGKKDFAAANCVRAFLGEENNEDAPGGPNGGITELVCNVDDMTGEAAGYLSSLMLREGALDFFVTAVQMKKNRPGFMFTCLCASDDADRMAALLLRHTTTFGVRRADCRRYTLDRYFSEKQTSLGPVRQKRGSGYGVEKIKAEYEDIKKAAEASGKSFSEVAEEFTKN